MPHVAGSATKNSPTLVLRYGVVKVSLTDEEHCFSEDPEAVALSKNNSVSPKNREIVEIPTDQCVTVWISLGYKQAKRLGIHVDQSNQRIIGFVQ